MNWTTERRKLGDLKPWEKNPRKISEEQAKRLLESWDLFGQVDTIAIGPECEVYNGHQRLSVLLAAYGPDYEIDVRVAPWALTESERKRLTVYLHKSAAGEWDEEMLKANFAFDEMKDFGWPEDELNAMFSEMLNAETKGETDPDDVPEVIVGATTTQRGDLWILDGHRLLCGDSTSPEDVANLMDGQKAGLMNTDPPYGVAYANDDRPNPGVAKPRVANDQMTDQELQSFLESAFRAAVDKSLLPNAAWYMWHAHLTQGYFAAAAAAANVVLHRQIIWVKPVLLLGRGHFHWKHEPCFMGWVKGNQPPDYGEGNGERTQTTIWEVGSVSQSERKEFNHSTPKPVGLFTLPIVKHLRKGEICYEPFAGSGPQIIAAEMLGRRCFAIEIEPSYVDVCVKRWENFTGKRADLVRGEAEQLARS